MKHLKSLEKLVLISLIIAIPTQLAYHVWPSWAFVYGLRIDLLAPTLYLTDLFIVGLILINLPIFYTYKKYISALLIIMTINSLFSVSPPESLYKWFKLLEYMLFTIYVSKQKILNSDSIIKILFYSGVVVSIIGITQFITGGTLGGLLYWLGERNFTTSTPGIALVTLAGADYLRAYSIFPHPNALAGYLSIVLLLVLFSKNLTYKTIELVALLLIGVCLVLTFSLSALLGLILILTIKLICKTITSIQIMKVFLIVVAVSILFPMISSKILTSELNLPSNISERLKLGYIAGLEISNHYISGSGLGTFPLLTVLNQTPLTFNWLLVPVHNIYLLVLTETGLLGFIACCLVVYYFLLKIKPSNLNYLFPIIFILFTGLMDHYWFTLQQNQLLISLLIGLMLL